MPSGKPLRLLHMEDSQSDSGWIVGVLLEAGYDVRPEKLATAVELRAALLRDTWDLIIADIPLSRLDAVTALEILHETGLDIPFIVVSSGAGEELAVAMMKAGAHDYVLKADTSRLVPAIEREIREARFRRERKQAEDNFRESQERLALAIQAAQLGTFDFSPSTGALVASESNKRHFGLSPDAPVTYDSLLGAVHPDDRDRIHATVQNLLSSPSGGHYAAEFRTIGLQDQVERYIALRGCVLFNSAGRPVRFVGVTLDNTERKRLEDQFRQAQKMESIGRLAGGVAHDFNNLLTVINGYSDMLLAGMAQEDPLHESITEIRTAGERAAALSAQLLIFSRKQVVQSKIVNLNDIITEVKKMLGRIIGDEIRFESALDPALGSVRADPGQLHQVLLNLAINARDAMPGGGTLCVETRNFDLAAGARMPGIEIAPGSYIELRITDTGLGMPPEVLSHIFEPFFTTKKAGEGTGLGLATVYGIVQQCGGSISVWSEPGCGTSFRIYLPRCADARAASAGPKPPAPPRRGTETILVVEDQDQVRSMAIRVLRDCGYFVLEAAGPEAALSESAQFDGPIHLLLTDIVMPEISGYDLAHRLRRLRPYIEVVFMSGYSEQAERHRLMGGDGDYLAKPFSPEALSTVVRHALDRRTAATILIAAGRLQERRVLCKLLTGAGYHVQEAADAQEAVRQLETSIVDILIADLAMSVPEGRDTLGMMCPKWPKLKIVALGGAGGFTCHADLLKPINPQQLFDVLDRLTGRQPPGWHTSESSFGVKS